MKHNKKPIPTAIPTGNKARYASQRLRSDANKRRRMEKFVKRKSIWLLRGQKKNGKPVRPIKTTSRSVIIG